MKTNFYTRVVLFVLFLVSPMGVLADGKWKIQYKLEGDTEYRLFDWDSWVALDKSNSNHETFSYNGNVGKISGLIDAMEIKMSGKYPYTRSQLGFNELFVMLTKPVTRYKDVSQQWVNDNVNEKLRKVDLSDVIGMDDNIEMMFFKCHVLEEVLFPNELVKSSYSSLDSSFWMCYKLKKADMTSFHNIASMQQTFAYCQEVKEITFSDYQTSPDVKTVYCIVAMCFELETLDLSMFRKVRYSYDIHNPSVDRMFLYCKRLKYVKMPYDFLPQNNRHGIEDPSLDIEQNFEGTNGNCIVYLEQPDFYPENIDTWHNVARKKTDGTYEAIKDFEISRYKRNYECPYPVDLGEHQLLFYPLIDSDSWQSFYIPFSLKYDDWKDNFEIAYINDVHQYDDDDDGNIDRTNIEIIKIKDDGVLEPNTPYLIKAKTEGDQYIKACSNTLSLEEEKTYSVSSWFHNFNFTGTYQRIDNMATNGYYAMSDGVLKKASSDDVVLKPFRWYLSVTDRNGNPVNLNSKSMSIVFDDSEATGIKTISNGVKGSTSIHTLTGISKGNDVKSLVPGVYIMNGKKFIVK